VSLSKLFFVRTQLWAEYKTKGGALFFGLWTLPLPFNVSMQLVLQIYNTVMEIEVNFNYLIKNLKSKK
jgi:hypothetical protein